MTASALSKPQRVFLLCALAFCLVAMHHFIATTGMPEMSPSATTTSAGHGQGTADVAEENGGDPAEPHGEHGFLHLCLAVLGAVGVLIALLVLLLRLRETRQVVKNSSGAAELRAPPAPSRPPDRRGRLILNSFCVLRV